LSYKNMNYFPKLLSFLDSHLQIELLKSIKTFDTSAAIKSLSKKPDTQLVAPSLDSPATSQQLDALLAFAQQQFQKNDYKSAISALQTYRSSGGRQQSSLWGLLTSHIKTAELDAAGEIVHKLVQELSGGTHLSQLLTRTWILHASLFCKGDVLVDIGFLPAFVNTVQTSCVWILRYLAVQVVCKKRKGLIKELVKILAQERDNYSDAITETLAAIYLDFDFQKALTSLETSREIFENDMFIASYAQEFTKAAKSLVFDFYVKIYKTSSVATVCEVLKVDQSWISSVLSKDMKIEDGFISVNTSPARKYQQVIDRTAVLTSRHNALLEMAIKLEQECKAVAVE